MDDRRSPGLGKHHVHPQDVNEENGGTLIIPDRGWSGGSISELPPTVNLEAKAVRLCCSTAACCMVLGLTDPPNQGLLPP